MIDGCWNTVGVRGDMGCPELVQYVHCRNCPVYAAAAGELLRQASPDGSIVERTGHFAKPKQLAEAGTDSILVFRLAGERMALPTVAIKEVVEPRQVHSLPHRRSAALLGLTNVRGELLVTVDLSVLLVLGPESPRDQDPKRVTSARVLVLARETLRVACPVDDVYGVQRTVAAALRHVPATLANASARYSKGLLPGDGSAVSLLDDELLFYTLRRCLT